eukprot:TRINITY_DN14013_c0_g1_i3.p1 TRINITY_DN14013_c0_g1~~TRINITY_DN14013_c0_g1_i3.p1  ORF type:complete len:498 (+),score=95.52 TRINITY_DN14013_c0_g1_i3:127-1620(+)
MTRRFESSLPIMTVSYGKIKRVEIICFTGRAQKLNAMGWKKDFNLMVTNKAIYILKPKGPPLKRKIPFESLGGVTKSNASQEFVVHVPAAHDQRFVSKHCKSFLEQVKESYLKTQGKNLPVYEMESSNLKDCVTTKADKRNGVSRVPDKKFMVVAEDAAIEDLSMLEADVKISKGTCIWYRDKADADISLADFKVVKFTDKTAYEYYYLVECTALEMPLIMMEIKKCDLLDTSAISAAKVSQVIESCSHPFLASPKFAFQNSTGLYFFFEQPGNGTLAALLEKCKRLPEKQVQFYMSQITLALIYLHKHNLTLYELQPENLYIDHKGYITINPFTIYQFTSESQAFPIKAEQSVYFAPELCIGATFATDWWSLGIIMYRMLVGVNPPLDSNNQVVLKYPDTSKYFIFVTDAATDLISWLLEKDAKLRIGEEKVLEHAFISKSGLDIEKLMQKEMVEYWFTGAETEKLNKVICESTAEPITVLFPQLSAFELDKIFDS